MVVPLDRGREAYRRQEWGESYAQLSLAARETRLELEDLERLAAVSYLTGRDDESDDFWARAHHESLRVGDPVRGARCAFWLGNGLMLRGEAARGGGWFARAQRLLDDCEQDCVERGYLLVRSRSRAWPRAIRRPHTRPPARPPRSANASAIRTSLFSAGLTRASLCSCWERPSRAWHCSMTPRLP